MKVVDLTVVTNSMFTNIGKPICDDLKSLGWVVLRSPFISNLADSKLRSIASRGTWHSIEKNRVMKYNENSVLPKSWLISELSRMKKLIQSKIVERVCPNKGYELAKLNILKSLVHTSLQLCVPVEFRSQ